MRYIDCRTPSLPAPPPPRGARVPRFIGRLAPVLAPALVVAALGCREGAESPTAPEPGAALDITPAHALSFRQISTGGSHSCGVTTDDRAYCWGDNNSGQLGDGTSENVRLRPVPVSGGLRFRQVSASSHHTCGVTTENVAYCWGIGRGLGHGTTLGSPTPVAVSGGRRFRGVSAGSDHTCGVTTSDRAFCWGDNLFGQLGDGTTDVRLTPVRVAGGLRLRQVSAAFTHTCGVTTDNLAYCWGSNSLGRLGDGTGNSHLTPVAVVGGRRFRQVSVGHDHTCGLTPANGAYCWGSNFSAQLGDNTRTGRLEPVHVHAQGRKFLQIEAGALHTCAVATDNVAYCWGANAAGQLGNGTTFRRPLPTAVAGGLRFGRISAGQLHTCGVTTDNVGQCWGRNAQGQLGDGTTIQRLTPVPVAAPGL